MKKKERIDILFIDGVVPRNKNFPSFIGFIFNIGAILRLNNYSFKIFNLSILEDYTIYGMLSELKKIEFSSIGFSTHSENIRWVYKVVNVIKKEYPNIPIILGGPQVSFSDNKALNNCNCDIIVRHEGEETLLKLMNYYLRKEGALSLIDGITYRENDSIFKNKDAKLIDLNKLSTPLFEVFNDKQYWHIPDFVTEKKMNEFFDSVQFSNNAFLTSRGCPYQCVFCVEGSLKNKHRERSIDNVINDLEHYIKNTKLKLITIADDTFTSNRKRVLEICNRIKDLNKKYDFVWFAEARANVLAKNPELIEIMADAGLCILQIGIESGSQEVLNAQNKKITLAQIRTVAKAVGKLKDRNISLTGNFIFGGPGETKETMIETALFAKDLLEISDLNIELRQSFLVPFEGTPIRNSPDKFGLVILDEDFEMRMGRQFSEIVSHPKQLSKDDLLSGYLNFISVLNNFTYEKMFQLTKKEIDSKVFQDKYFAKKYYPTVLSAWTKTFYKLLLLQTYYELFEHNGTIKDFEIDTVINCCPLKIWEFNFSLQESAYKFHTFDGQVVIIKNEQRYLWENANGLLTFSEIVHNDTSPYKDMIDGETKAYEFYSYMYNKFALVFREY
jgi:radical SAM superfamily enzyme YgiQ (UPF0313 family)